MAEQILLSSVSFDGVREKGGFGQPLHALYPQIRAVLASELGSDTADLLAEPVVDRVRNRIDWYTEGDPDQPPVALSDLPEEQRQPILVRVNSLLARGREMAERYSTSGEPQRMQLGAMLKAVLDPPEETRVFLVNDRPVVAHWGFSSDRPWGAPGGSSRSALASSDPPSERMPDIAISEWEAAARHSTVTSEFPLLSEPAVESALPESLAESPLNPPPEPSPKASAEPPAMTLDQPPLLQPESSPTPKAPPPVKESLSSGVDHPDTGLRYVVVGSGYFWSVVALALLLALGAAFWNMTRSSPPSLAGEAAPLLPDPAPDRALADARQAEQALRVRLEQRLVALAEQRSRCSSPVGAEPGSIPSVQSTSLTPVVPSMPSTPSVSSAPSARSDRSAGATPSALTTPTTVPATPKPTEADAALAPAVEPGISDPAQPDVAPPAVGSRPSPPVTAPEPAAPAAGESVAQTLEEQLSDSRPGAGAPPLVEPVSESPAPLEPTPEERQEFAKRLSASGAATGEITVTLLWDGNADLDLVVRCPSGQSLDYLTPQGCGGTLDVDANAARDSLSGKPVENIFWPAGQATPGAYKIAVRYEPRKDERNPQPVPFQVRLIRDSQEQVFKGTIRPRRTLPIANFTVVER